MNLTGILWAGRGMNLEIPLYSSAWANIHILLAFFKYTKTTKKYRQFIT